MRPWYRVTFIDSAQEQKGELDQDWGIWDKVVRQCCSWGKPGFGDVGMSVEGLTELGEFTERLNGQCKAELRGIRYLKLRGGGQAAMGWDEGLHFVMDSV